MTRLCIGLQAPRLAALPLLAALAACGGGENGASASARDSTSWHLGEQAVVIGAEDSPAHQLDRVYGGVIRPDGSVLIGNSGTAELRLFNARGVHQLTAGRMGGGPGEFRGINWVRPYRGDSLLVFDMPAQRFSVWSPEAAFGRSFRVQGIQGSFRPLGVFPDGSLLAALELGYDPRAPVGTTRDQIKLHRVSPEGVAGPELGTLPGAEWLLYRHPSSFRATQPPFGRQGHVVVTGDNIVYASSESSQLVVRDTAGHVVRSLTLPVAGRRPTEAEVDDEMGRIEDSVEKAAIQRHLSANDASLRTPAISDLRTDRNGRVWVRTGGAPKSGFATWLVVALPDGGVESVALPVDALPLDIHESMMLLRETDPEGVQRVLIRKLIP